MEKPSRGPLDQARVSPTMIQRDFHALVEANRSREDVSGCGEELDVLSVVQIQVEWFWQPSKAGPVRLSVQIQLVRRVDCQITEKGLPGERGTGKQEIVYHELSTRGQHART